MGAIVAVSLLCAAPAAGQEYSAAGAETCLPCHWTGHAKPATAILHTPHGALGDPDSPFGQRQCETCHGPSGAHAKAQQRGISRPPFRSFAKRSGEPVAAQNRVCLGCHTTEGRLGWAGSRHDSAAVACVACHRIHRERDPVFEPEAQQTVCFGCHPRRRADLLKSVTHPLRFGRMTCSDCHDPHNGHNDFLLRQSTINDTCYLCHAEKRGPFLWEHAPAAENCALCHRVHGSNHPALLARRPPLLCQQCHSPSGHPSAAYTSEQLDDPFANRFMLGRACLNCHSQVHGSNHPSGATLHR